MFDTETIREAAKIAGALNVDTSSLLAVAEVESGGKAYATVDGRQEPLIRFEGHYFDKRLTPEQRKRARAEGLASPKTGGVPNPSKQADRWKIVERAAKINRDAAYESISWGLGQVMGAHWEWLGFSNVGALVAMARKSIAGQMELMARFIEKSNLDDALRSKDWKKFAKGYNGPGYAKNAYDTKMAKADARWAKKLAAVQPTKLTPTAPQAPASVDLTARQVSAIMHLGSKGEFVVDLQKKLNTLGYGPLEPDGEFGEATDIAVKAFQEDNGLTPDGWAGPKTLEEIGKDLMKLKTAPKIEAAKEVVEEAANGDKNYSTTEIAAGAAGVAGAAGAVKSTVDAVSESAQSVGGLLVSVGPWVLLGVVVVAAAGYIWYSRRQQRIKATEVAKVL